MSKWLPSFEKKHQEIQESLVGLKTCKICATKKKNLADFPFYILVGLMTESLYLAYEKTPYDFPLNPGCLIGIIILYVGL